MTAKFHRGALHVTTSEFGKALADFDRSGEGDLANIGMGHQCF